MEFFTGLPVNTSDLMERGENELLDYLSETAGVNALIVNAHTFYGTCHYTPDDSFFHGTILRDVRPRQLGEYDVLAAVTDKAHRKGIKVYSHVLAYENTMPISHLGGKRILDEQGHEILPNAVLPNLSKVLEIDVFGRKGHKPCVSHPDYRVYYQAVLEEQLRNYPIDGINFNIERFGPIENTLLGNFGSAYPTRKPSAPACFCQHCQDRASRLGINVERARTGYLELLKFSEKSWLSAVRAGHWLCRPAPLMTDVTDASAPVDGYFIEFMRILMRWPEILAWNQMWYGSLHSWFKELYGTVKAVSPDRELGWHVWHPRDYSLFERASFDVSDMRLYADWVKPKMDVGSVGYRYHLQVEKMAQAMFPDRPLEKAYSAMNTILGWQEVPFDKLPEKSLGMDYIRRSTKSYLEYLKHEIPVYPGIGIDMPSGPAGHPGYHPTRPDELQDAIRTTWQCGAQGVVLSRVFGEMKHQNLVAAGEVIREIRRSEIR